MFSQQTSILHFSTQFPRSVLLRPALCSHHFLYTSGFQKLNWFLLSALHSRHTTVTINYRFERIFFSMCVCCVCVSVCMCVGTCVHVYVCVRVLVCTHHSMVWAPKNNTVCVPPILFETGLPLSITVVYTGLAGYRVSGDSPVSRLSRGALTLHMSTLTSGSTLLLGTQTHVLPLLQRGLSLLGHLQPSGYLTAVALTRPFPF